MAHTFYSVYVNNLKLTFNTNNEDISRVFEHEVEDYKEVVLSSFGDPRDLVQVVSVLNVLNASIVTQILNNVQDIDKTAVELAVYITSIETLIHALHIRGIKGDRYKTVLNYIVSRNLLVADLGLSEPGMQELAILNVLTVFYKYLVEIALTLGLGYELKEAAIRFKLLDNINKDMECHGEEEASLVKDVIDLELT